MISADADAQPAQPSHRTAWLLHGGTSPFERSRRDSPLITPRSEPSSSRPSKRVRNDRLLTSMPLAARPLTITPHSLNMLIVAAASPLVFFVLPHAAARSLPLTALHLASP